MVIPYNSDMKSVAPNAQIAALVLNWGPYYAKKIQQMIDGKWDPTPVWMHYKDGAMSLEGVRTDKIPADIVKKMEEVEIIGIRDTQKTSVTDIEMFRKLLDEGQAGDNVGLLLRGVKKEDIERGQVIIKPGTVKPHKNFKAEVYVLTKEEGGRHTPFFNGYRPQFYFRTTDVTGVTELPEGVEMVMPGDNVTMEVELITPIAIEKGLRFAIREGGRTVGAGVVSEVEEK